MNYPNIVTAIKTIRDARSKELVSGSLNRTTSDRCPFYFHISKSDILDNFNFNKRSASAKFLPYTTISVPDLTEMVDKLMLRYGLTEDEVKDLLEDGDKIFLVRDYLVNVQKAMDLFTNFYDLIRIDKNIREYSNALDDYFRGDTSYEDEVLDELISDIVDNVKDNFENSINSLK